MPPAAQLGAPRLPPGHWRNYRDVMSAAFAQLTPVAPDPRRADRPRVRRRRRQRLRPGPQPAPGLERGAGRHPFVPAGVRGPGRADRAGDGRPQRHERAT
ncbi:hypothetical protein G6F59_017570 [Rhizopus arrhizus]|nr:hypothetical protein G6F59_017570 [Rhizopus arrhizus]